MLVLGIETSCDETAAAVVDSGRKVLSNCLYSQIEEHKDWGGVIPEFASRLHYQKINKIIDIEQSIAFRASRHIMNRLDIFSRFFFPIVFSSWFNFTLFFLDYDIGKFKKIANFKFLQSHEIY